MFCGTFCSATLILLTSFVYIYQYGLTAIYRISTGLPTTEHYSYSLLKTLPNTYNLTAFVSMWLHGLRVCEANLIFCYPHTSTLCALRPLTVCQLPPLSDVHVSIASKSEIAYVEWWCLSVLTVTQLVCTKHYRYLLGLCYGQRTKLDADLHG